MSASTGTIQQPLRLGSILGAIAIALAALGAALVIGYMVLTATARSTGATLQPAAVWDHGSSSEAAPAPRTAPVVVNRGGPTEVVVKHGPKAE